jgi:hypothetical protein
MIIEIGGIEITNLKSLFSKGKVDPQLMKTELKFIIPIILCNNS